MIVQEEIQYPGIYMVELMKSGYPPVIIKVEDRLEYYKALDLASVDKKYDAFLKLTCKAVEESFEPYFFVLGEE